MEDNCKRCDYLRPYFWSKRVYKSNLKCSSNYNSLMSNKQQYLFVWRKMIKISLFFYLKTDISKVRFLYKRFLEQRKQRKLAKFI